MTNSVSNFSKKGTEITWNITEKKKIYLQSIKIICDFIILIVNSRIKLTNDQ